MKLTREEKVEMLVEHYHDFNIHDRWYELTTEHWQEKLNDEGFEDAEISLSGFWSQGDGASFTCPSIDVRKFIKAHLKEVLNGHVSNIFDLRAFLHGDTSHPYGEFEFDCSIERTSFHNYCHENTISAEWEAHLYEYDPYNNPEADENELVYFLGQTLGPWIEDRARDLSREIYSNLEDEYEYLTSEEAIIETLQINEIIDQDLNFIDPDDSIYPEEEYEEAA